MPSLPYADVMSFVFDNKAVIIDDRVLYMSEETTENDETIMYFDPYGDENYEDYVKFEIADNPTIDVNEHGTFTLKGSDGRHYFIEVLGHANFPA